MTTLVSNFQIRARRIGGPLAEQIAAELHEAGLALEAMFTQWGIPVEITIGTEPDKPWFRIVVAWVRGIGTTAEPWDRVFTLTLSQMLELHRTMSGDVGLQLAERLWLELMQFDRQALAGMLTNSCQPK
jgi:hypothetical protein